jgi:hypothetical protein
MNIISVLSLALLLFSLPACDSGNPKETSPVCGDGIVSPNSGEECEAGQLSGFTCESFGMENGVLGCSGLCRFDTSGCVPVTVCGDGVIEGDEECEYVAAADACLTAGFPAGLALCRMDCRLDTAWCTDGTCDNRLDDSGAGYDCDDPACQGRMGCPQELCTDAIDNDGDELTDCLDPDCATHAPGCNAGCNFHERDFLDGCSDGHDSDCDGLTDADDPDCDGDPGVLLMYFPVTGRPVAGAIALVSITFFAQDEGIPSTTLTWTVSERLTEVTAQDGGSYEAAGRTLTWQVAARAQGRSVTVHALVRIDPEIEAGTEVCSSARLNTAPPMLTDDPALPGAADALCVRVLP